MSDRAREIWGYAAGLLLAATLTAGAFAAVRWPTLFGSRTFAIVCALGLTQTIIQFRFFLDIGIKRSGRDNLLLLLFSSLIIALMVGGTLVLMANLRQRMM